MKLEIGDIFELRQDQKHFSWIPGTHFLLFDIKQDRTDTTYLFIAIKEANRIRTTTLSGGPCIGEKFGFDINDLERYFFKIN